MISAALIGVAMLVAPTQLDLPPEIVTTATADIPATRVSPPEEAVPAVTPGAPEFDDQANGSACTGLRPLLAFYSPGWDVNRMSAIAYRESRCQPRVSNSSGATGLLQILRSHCPWLARQMDTWCTQDRLRDPEFNVRAAAVLWREQGYGAWSTA